MDKMNATSLRQNIYAVLDTIMASGQPVYISRKGCTFQIRLLQPEKVSLDALPEIPDLVTGDGGDLPNIHWDDTWSPEKNLDKR